MQNLWYIRESPRTSDEVAKQPGCPKELHETKLCYRSTFCSTASKQVWGPHQEWTEISSCITVARYAVERSKNDSRPTMMAFSRQATFVKPVDTSNICKPACGFSVGGSSNQNSLNQSLGKQKLPAHRSIAEVLQVLGCDFLRECLSVGTTGMLRRILCKDSLWCWQGFFGVGAPGYFARPAGFSGGSETRAR